MIQNTPQATAAKPDTKLVLESTALDEQRRRLARIKRSIRRQTGGAVHEHQRRALTDPLVGDVEPIRFDELHDCQHPSPRIAEELSARTLHLRVRGIRVGCAGEREKEA